jgi:hypothetical protein
MVCMRATLEAAVEVVVVVGAVEGRVGWAIVCGLVVCLAEEMFARWQVKGSTGNEWFVCGCGQALGASYIHIYLTYIPRPLVFGRPVTHLFLPHSLFRLNQQAFSSRTHYLYQTRARNACLLQVADQ